VAKWVIAARYGGERIRFYNPVKIVKFVSKKEIYLNRNFLPEIRAAGVNLPEPAKRANFVENRAMENGSPSRTAFRASQRFTLFHKQ